MNIELGSALCNKLDAVSDVSIDFVKEDIKVTLSQEVDEEGQTFFQAQIKTDHFLLKSIATQELQELFHRDPYMECQYLEKLYQIFSDSGNFPGYGLEKAFTREQFEQMILRDANRCAHTTFTGYFVFNREDQVVGRAVLGQSFHPFDPKLFGHYAPAMNETQAGVLLETPSFSQKNYREVLRAIIFAAEIFKEQHIYKHDCNQQLKPVDRVVLTLLDLESIDKVKDQRLYQIVQDKVSAANSVGLVEIGRYKSAKRSMIIFGKGL